MDVSQSDRITSNSQRWNLAGAFINNIWKNTVQLVIFLSDIEGSNIKEENNRWDFDLLGRHLHPVLSSGEIHTL